MTQQTPIQQLTIFLHQQGVTDEVIEQTALDILKSSSLLLFTNAMAIFSEEDIIAIEQCATDEEATSKVMELYKLRTEKDPQEEHKVFLQKAVSAYIAEYSKPQQS